MADVSRQLRYHTSLPANRQSILERGLLPQNPLTDFNEAAFMDHPKGVYMWMNLTEIDDPVFDPYDVYEVDVTGLETITRSASSCWRPEPVEPGRLMLLRPARV